MNDQSTDRIGINEMVHSWNKTMSGIWEAMGKFWMADATAEPAEQAKDTSVAHKNIRASMNSAVKKWQTMMGMMNAPDTYDSLFKGAGAMPGILMNMAQTGFGGFLQLQEKLAAQTGKIGKTVEAYKFEDLDENIIRAFEELYEKEFRQFFRVPQLGLMRTYQEKANDALDKYNRYQLTVMEFIRILCEPIQHSFYVLQQKLDEMAEAGELPEDSQTYYQMWIKILEGHYMTLYQTPEYARLLAKTLNTKVAYKTAANAVFEDMLSEMPIPKRSEVDDLEKEVYELKKLVRSLTKTAQVAKNSD